MTTKLQIKRYFAHTILRASFLESRMSSMRDIGLTLPPVQRELNSPSVVKPKKYKKVKGKM